MKRKLDSYFFIPVMIIILVSLYLVIQLSGFTIMRPKANNSKGRQEEGFFLLYNLLDRLGYKITRWPENRAPEEKGCLVMLNYQEENEQLLTEVLEWVERGNTLILFGLLTDKDPVFQREIVEEPLDKVSISSSLGSNVTTSTLTSSQFFNAPEGEILLAEGEKTVLWRTDWGTGSLLLLTDSRLANNKSLEDMNRAILFNNLFKEFYPHPVYFFESRMLSKQANPILVLFKKPFFFLTFHLLMGGVFFLLYSGKQFGNLRPMYVNPRRTIVEHMKAVASFYEKTGSQQVMEDLNQEYFVYQLMQKRKLKKAYPTWEEVKSLADQIKMDAKIIQDAVQAKRNPSRTNLIKRRQYRDRILSKI